MCRLFTCIIKFRLVNKKIERLEKIKNSKCYSSKEKELVENELTNCCRVQNILGLIEIDIGE